MDADDIKEIAKNVKITGEINSATVEKVSKELMPQLMPYLWGKEIMGLISSVVWGGFAIVITFIIATYYSQ